MATAIRLDLRWPHSRIQCVFWRIGPGPQPRFYSSRLERSFFQSSARSLSVPSEKVGLPIRVAKFWNRLPTCLLTCTCVGNHPGRIEPASPIALTTSRTEALQARRSCASSLDTFTQSFLHRAWPKTPHSHCNRPFRQLIKTPIRFSVGGFVSGSPVIFNHPPPSPIALSPFTLYPLMLFPPLVHSHTKSY